MLFLPFGRHRHYSPPQPARPSGHWEKCPHWSDGYWVEYTPEKMADITGIPQWRGYIFSRYLWEWPGYKVGDRTWTCETFKGKKLDKPKPWEWVPDYDPFLPGTRYNL